MVTIVGGGLAGSEAAWQAASLGAPVTLYEMRPVRPTAVHKTDRLADCFGEAGVSVDEGPDVRGQRIPVDR